MPTQSSPEEHRQAKGQACFGNFYGQRRKPGLATCRYSGNVEAETDKLSPLPTIKPSAAILWALHRAAESALIARAAANSPTVAVTVTTDPKPAQLRPAGPPWGRSQAAPLCG